MGGLFEGFVQDEVGDVLTRGPPELRNLFPEPDHAQFPLPGAKLVQHFRVLGQARLAQELIDLHQQVRAHVANLGQE